MPRHPHKQATRDKRAASILSERQARAAFERRCELAPLARTARGVKFSPGYVSSVGAALLAAFDREGV
jgi:hypothetical protein